ncbi:MAG: LysM peptidoglycan-binding domain-containing protein [Spirochaetales bacterium]|nr:LysM peptidoglycan-binding domain-containing protein [Spirochaetales bacterium]
MNRGGGTIKGGTLFFILLTAGGLLFSQENHRVERDETLYSIALSYQISLDDLMAANSLEDDFIKEGQILTLPGQEEGEYWTVKAGDSLSLISLKTDVSQEAIKEANGLTDDKILLGQKLIIPSEENRDRTYLVNRGDSLWKIASAHNTTTDALIRLNRLETEKIYPGMELKLPLLNSPNRGINVLKAMLNNHREPEQGPWFNSEPDRRTQPSLEYGELSSESTVTNYAQAREVLKKLDGEVDRAGLLSRDLRGWTIVIDPGHGGLDPGAVVETVDGNGHSAIVVEDEYAYDISLRVYALLKQHGADAGLTIISPNHHIRHTPDASLTFVNEKNEVYNSASLNRTGDWDEWPAGGRVGLAKRLTTAEEIIESEGNAHSLYLSIHCDNTPGGFPQSGILAYGEDEEELARSVRFAQAFDESFPAGLEFKEQEVFVLQGNPARDGAALMEIRNVHYDNNSWALRNEELRDQDAEKIVQSILHFVSTY